MYLFHERHQRFAEFIEPPKVFRGTAHSPQWLL